MNKTCSGEDLQILLKHFYRLNSEEVYQLITDFPYQNIISISHLDQQSIG